MNRQDRNKYISNVSLHNVMLPFSLCLVAICILVNDVALATVIGLSSDITWQPRPYCPIGAEGR